MIFVTVGAQMPFDRLVRTIDSWAEANRDAALFAQIGPGAYRPRHIPSAARLDPVEFRQRLFDADLVVTHAGMGTIITALEFARPIVVMPRRADLHETRNDHQLGTAKAIRHARRVTVAWDEQELLTWLDRRKTIPSPQRITSHASFQLLRTLRNFIRPGEAPPATAPGTTTPSRTEGGERSFAAEDSDRRKAA